MRKKRMFKNALWFIEVLAVVLLFYSCAGSVSPNNQAAPARTGLNNGGFLPCPGSPNCVSSMEVSGPAAIAPLDSGLFSRSQAVERLLALLQADKNCQVVEYKELQDDSVYVRAEYRSRLFRFVDDVEFLFLPESSLIHVKSASRVGYSDMGVNRKRVEAIRTRFSQVQS